MQFHDTPGRHLVHETVYPALYAGDGTLSRDLCRSLRTGRRRCKARRRPDARRPNGFIDPMTLIDHRPAEAADRAVAGHWEGDLLMGAGNRWAIGTLAERSTRHVILVRLGRSRTAEGVRDALVPKGTDLSRHDAEHLAALPLN